jgi:fructan beta-fructosidase
MKNLLFFLLITSAVFAQEKHRPQLHFTPPSMWMNDPNGMFYANGTYHLYYQYHPESTVWGPMHWGHATSKDLMRWEHQPVALYPDSLGLIFSGSAVIDHQNTSGFGKNGIPPVVAIYTSHNLEWEKAGRIDRENQSIAYSLDGGQTFTKFAGNPVIKNPGIADFRDPNVSWYAPGKKWIMALATQDREAFYSSPDLKNWTKESEFGAKMGAHGGVWECPDMFPMQVDGKTKWVLIVNINPGAPNGGSGAQYFVGDFDGHQFTPQDEETRWIDYGRDNYAGVTFHETGDKRIFMGWMSNWDYATVVPTESWRSANTLPRDLKLVALDGKYVVASTPIVAVSNYVKRKQTIKSNNTIKTASALQRLTGTLPVQDFSITLSNSKGEQVIIGFEASTNRYFVDRDASGDMKFSNKFAGKAYAPRLSKSNTIDFTLITDVASAEFFADGGLSVLTTIYFPSETFKNLKITSAKGLPFLLEELKPSM